MTTHICVFSTIHYAHDVRMSKAEAESLARAGFTITVIACQDRDEEDHENMLIIPLVRPVGARRRLLRGLYLLRLAAAQHADAYAFHDPELLPVAVLLRLWRRRPVIYDAHEDVPVSLHTRAYLPPLLRPLAAHAFRVVEKLCLPFLTAVTVADHAYLRYYRGYRAVPILNYPLLTYSNLYTPPVPRSHIRLVYVGSVTRLRGLEQMLRLVARVRSHVSLSLSIVGPMGTARDAEFADKLVGELSLQSEVHFTGPVSHLDAHRKILDADIGLALLLPDPNYLRSLPTKMFEYMMMGRPVVVSSFPLWQEIVKDAQCGCTVDPLDLNEIEATVLRLARDRPLRLRLGTNGRKAVLKHYNWTAEARKLVKLYRDVTSQTATRS